MTRYNPWRHLRDLHPDVHLTCHLPTPPGVLGLWHRAGLTLSPRQTQAQRRCTLAHELVHMDRGPCEHGDAREEDAVDELAARRLITLEQLVDAVRWDQGRVDPDELWVDLPTLQTRIRTLTDAERDHIEEAIRA